MRFTEHHISLRPLKEVTYDGNYFKLLQAGD
jgi:hypothetical protein